MVSEVPRTLVPATKDVQCKALPSEVFTKMRSFVREGTSELSLYTRVCYILVETLCVYGQYMPSEVKVKVQPTLTFENTDKSTDFALVSITTVSTLCVFFKEPPASKSYSECQCLSHLHLSGGRETTIQFVVA